MVKQRTVVGLLSLAIILCAPHVLAAPMPINDATMQVAAVNIVDNSSADPAQAVKYININTQKRRALDKRAPPVAVPDGPTPEGPTAPNVGPNPPMTPKPTPPVNPPTVTTDPKPPVTTDPKPPVTTDPKPPVTTDPKPPATTDPVPPTTTSKTTSSSTSSEAEETTSPTKSTSNLRPTGSSKPKPGAPGPHSPAPSVPAITTNSAIPPTATPETSSGAPILPIVLGSVLGVGVLIAAGAFFFIRFRKGRRFDRKQPLSFLAVSLDDPSGSDRHLSTPSSGGALAGALAIARGGLDRDNDEIRYSPPTPIGANNNRFSYPSSDNSGPAVNWNPDDENAALVGGYGHQQQQQQQQHYHQQEERDLLSDENGFRPPSESFVASSMMPLAANDPRHQRSSGRQQAQQGAFSPEPEMRELTPGQLRVVGGSPELSRSEVQSVQGARESLDVRPEGADVRSQHGSIRSNVSGKDPKTDEIMYL
ncbi:hypothetical protein BG006_006626 [Podila minutissima]|uniref:Uncharacterized protein n=1 Tax=Podila minutissima TaxID=64525 RepID=A0A9P5VRG1_9FUNG|nr:hypothetical protein BG006_006626 [Podila minutissima]